MTFRIDVNLGSRLFCVLFFYTKINVTVYRYKFPLYFLYVCARVILFERSTYMKSIESYDDVETSLAYIFRLFTNEYLKALAIIFYGISKIIFASYLLLHIILYYLMIHKGPLLFV